MEVVIHRHIDALTELIPEYNELKSEFREITVFHEVQSLICWWNHYKTIENISPFIVEVKKENKKIGILPLYVSEKKFASKRFRIIRPNGINEAIYLIPILLKKYSTNEIIKVAMEKLNKENANWDCIHWCDLPEGTNLDNFLKKLMNYEQKRNQITRKVTSRSSSIIIHEELESINKNMSRSFLKEIR